MRTRKPNYKARRWLASEERRDRRNLPWGVSFTGLDSATQAEVVRRGFKIS
jgi:hypothetical protein